MALTTHDVPWQTTADSACIYLCFTQATDFKYIDLYQKDKYAPSFPRSLTLTPCVHNHSMTGALSLFCGARCEHR